MTAPVIERVEVTEPGVYEMDDVTYHGDPVPGGSLSSSGARRLLPPSCPAIFDYERKNGRPGKKVFDIGHAAHKLALGVGPDIVEVEADSWRTNAAKDRGTEIREAGGVPLLTDEFGMVTAMAVALAAHPIAGALFSPGNGTPEASMFWTDSASGITCRSRLDWLPKPRPGKRFIVVDYKTARSAEPQAFAKAAMDHGYHCQAPWYCDGVVALGIAEDPLFVFVVQEKTPPYLVTVVQLDDTAMRIGRILNRRAIGIYAECSATDTWPGYATDVAQASLPYYYERQFGDEL